MNLLHKFFLSRKAVVGLWVFMLTGITTYGQAPKAGYKQDKTEGCIPLIVNFTDNSSGNITAYYWDFGNGNTSVLQNPGALYSKAGVYTVKLVVTDNTGKKDSITKTAVVAVYNNPIAAFSAQPTNACKGDAVKFTNTSTETSNPIVSHVWNFGDGQLSNDKSPSHIYTTEGSFGVSLIVTDSKGCKSSVNQTNLIQVSTPPQVSFTANTNAGCTVPLTVNFTNTSPAQAGKTYNYFWDFGDGQTATTATPSNTYNGFGSYKVSLRVTDNLGCSAVLAQDKFVLIGKPKASFNANTQKGCLPLLVKFNNTSTDVPLGAKYVWYFSNGDSVVGANPSYVFTKEGTYGVKLVITSAQGCGDVIEKQNYISVVANPGLDFKASDSALCFNPANVNFTSNTPGIVSWNWDFGDANKATTESPDHLYNNAGIYTVNLTATFANGCTLTKTKPGYIKVAALRALFNVSDTAGCVPLTINFTNLSTAAVGIKTYEWDFGDGQKSTQLNPTHIYTKPGKYYPYLSITDSAGCTDRFIFNRIVVGEKANPDFVADKREGCKQDMAKVRFTNLTNVSKVKVDFFIWETGVNKAKVFDTSSIIEDYRPYEFNTSPDSVNIKLISYSNGCYDTIEKKNYITLHPPDAKVSFTIDKCKLDTITFTNTSYGADVFEWSMNGVPIADTVKFKMFLPPGKHFLTAKATNNTKGCKDARTYEITILEPLVAGIGTQSKGLCAGDSITFFSNGNNKQRLIFEYLWTVNGTPVSTKWAFTKLFTPGTYDIKHTIKDEYGCVKDTTLYDAVNGNNASVGVAVVPSKGCFPHPASLIVNTPLTGLKNPRWTLYGSLLPATNDTLQYVFDKVVAGMNVEGIPVLFEAEDSTGCVVKKEIKVIVSNVSAGFANTPQLGCNKTDMQFFNSSVLMMAHGGITFNWTLDDTVFNTLPVYKHSFTTSGKHKMRLQIKDTLLGCTDETEKEFDVKVRRLNAGFEVDKTQISCPPLVSTFTDASKAENTVIDNVKWWFGDGSTSDIKKPVKHYFYPGNYDISYKIADITGCSDSITIPGKILIGGPRGTMNVDRYQGCEPLLVNYHITNPSTGNVKWDFGDGTIFSGNSAQNKYNRPGTYYPHMVLEDSVGCVVFYPSPQPLVVHPSPKPSFTFSGVCLYDVFAFTNTTNTADPQSFVWKLGNGDSIFGKNIKYKYTNPGTYTVELAAKSQNGCKTSAFDTVHIPTLKALFEPSNKFACLGGAVSLIDKSLAGAGIQQWQWSMGNGITIPGEKPTYSYTVPGNYNLSLIIKDNNGCFDTALNAQSLTVFDTLPPIVPTAFRVTVEENNTLRFEYAKYKEPDFGAYAIYKAKAGEPLQLYKKISVLADTVYTDAAVNPDDFSYTYKIVNQSFCGKYSDIMASIPQTSILLKGEKDTNLLHLNWSPYGGWNKVRYYHIYRKAPGENTFTKIDTVLGAITAYTDTNAYCDAVYRYYVVAEEEAPQPLFSRSNTVVLTPYHKLTVQPGTIIRATVEDDKNILVEFEGPKTHRAPVVSYLLQKSWDGINYQTAEASPTCCPSYLDKNVNVHRQSYYYRLQCMDVCSDISMPGNIGKSILLNAHINEDENVQVDWSAYQQWDVGINNYQLEFKKPDGVYQYVATNNFNDTDYIDATGTYNTVTNICYRVKATSNTGVVSYSNTDCVKGRSSLFVPNAFTPNGDGENDRFVVVGAYIKTYKIQIFTRWGEWVYTSHSLEDSWDGIFKNQPVHDQVYVYVIEAIGMDSKKYSLRGNITVLN